jgi:hypothetical protein
MVEEAVVTEVDIEERCRAKAVAIVESYGFGPVYLRALA